MKSASFTHSSTVFTTLRRLWLAPGFNPTRSSAGQALAMLARRVCSPFGAGSQATTSRPLASARAAQPLPITPAPITATVLMLVM